MKKSGIDANHPFGNEGFKAAIRLFDPDHPIGGHAQCHRAD
jgi:hypothetical protein